METRGRKRVNQAWKKKTLWVGLEQQYIAELTKKATLVGISIETLAAHILRDAAKKARVDDDKVKDMIAAQQRIIESNNRRAEEKEKKALDRVKALRGLLK